jgi:hypothetical protein
MQTLHVLVENNGFNQTLQWGGPRVKQFSL